MAGAGTIKAIAPARMLRKGFQYMKMLKGGPIGAVGTVRSFMNVVKDIDFEEVRDRAERVPRMLILAPDDALAEQATNQLFGTVDRGGISIEAWADRESLDASRY